MIIKDASLKNIRNFRELEKFNFIKRGMVLINGINGVGKTTIFNCLRICLFGSMNDGSTAEDLVRNDKDSHIIVNLENNGHEYTVSMTRTKKKWAKKVTKNGADITPHSQTNFWTSLTKELDFTKEEWDASVHLSQKTSHILVSGKPTARKDYISEFFGIDGDFDTIKSAAEKELALITKEIADIESFTTARQTLQSELDQTFIPNVDQETIKRAQVKEQIDLNTSSITTLKEKQKSYNLFASYKDSAYPEGCGEGIDSDYSVNHYRKLKSDSEALFKNYKQIQSYNENVVKNNHQYEELTKIVAQNSDYDTRFPESAEVYQKEQNELELKRSFSMERGKVQSLIDSISEYEGKTLVDATEIANMDSDLKNKSNEYAVLDHEYKRMAQGKCPTCGHEHDSSDITSKYDTLVALHAEINTIISTLSINRNLNAKISELTALKTKLVGIPEFTSNESLRLDELQHVLPKLRIHNNQKDQLSKMVKQEFVDAPSQPPTEAELATIDYSITYFSNISEARRMCPKPSEVSGIDIVSINSSVSSLTQKNSSLEEDIRSIDAALLNAKDLQNRHDRLTSQIATIDLKFSTLGKLKEAEFFWKTMVQAYGPKGIRVHQLQKVMNLITDVLPMYTSLMFEATRSYEFSSECDAGNILIKVKRKDVEGEYEHDIASLSGGESKKIAVCLILAVAKIRLARKSVNMVVLDEVDSQMDKESRFQFTNELLPTIKGQFDTVFVVSHHDDTFQTAIYDEKLLFKPESENSHYTNIKSTVYDH